MPGSNSYVHVLLHSANGYDERESGAEQCTEPFSIGDRLWLCRLSNELRDVVYKACAPQGEPYEKVYRQFGQLYTIALFVGPAQPGTVTGWDAFGEITKFVAYSQLTHPTSIGFGDTAVLEFNSVGDFVRAIPGPCRGITEIAFVVPPMRNWLSKSECETVKNLFFNSDFQTLPDRIARAHWNLQHSAYQFFFEVRTMLVASGLDAIVHVRKSANKAGGQRGPGTGKQFTARTVKLANEVGVPCTEDDAWKFWDQRSDVAHGRDPWQSVRDPKNPKWKAPELTRTDPMVQRYLTSEEILRRTVVKCLTDPQFAAKFVSDDTVKSAYPV